MAGAGKKKSGTAKPATKAKTVSKKGKAKK